MKKAIILLVLVLLLSGCGCANKNINSKSTIICDGKTITEKSGEMPAYLELEYDNARKTITSAKVKYTLDLSGYTDAQIDALKEYDLCANLKLKYDLEACDSQVVNRSAIMNATFKTSYLLQQEFHSADGKVSIEDIKDVYNRQLNTTCVVK